MITKNEIEQILYSVYNTHVSKYGKNHIFGSFVVGKANYGFAETIDEIRCVTVYIPTFEELCLSLDTHKEKDVYDIRQAYNAIYNHSDAALELLYSDYFTINPKFQKIWNNIYSQRDKISKVNRKERLTKAKKRAVAAYEQGDLFEAMRLYIGSKLYYQNYNCEKCFHIDDYLYKNILWTCKHTSEISTINFEEMMDELDNLIDTIDDTLDYDTNIFIKRLVLDTISFSLNNTISYDVFIEGLSPLEKKALEAIYSYMENDVALISISKITKETDISRPVFNNLFNKMEKNNFAKIENQGVKGTRITLIK